MTRSLVLEMPFLLAHAGELIVARDVDLRPTRPIPLAEIMRGEPCCGKLAWLRLRLVCALSRAADALYRGWMNAPEILVVGTMIVRNRSKLLTRRASREVVNIRDKPERNDAF